MPANGRVLVVVPALNEERSVGDVVRSARAEIGPHVVVVDDGSTDDTAAIARSAGASVVSLPFNLGIGGAVRAGLRYAFEHGFDRVVQLDGDGQHEPRDALRLLEALEDGNDLVVGSRFAAGYPISGARRWAMRRLARMASRRLDTNLTDSTSGFRAFGPRAIALFARDYPQDYMESVEALLLAGEAGLRVREVDVTMHERSTGKPSAGWMRSAFHLTRMLLGVLVRLVRRPRPRSR